MTTLPSGTASWGQCTRLTSLPCCPALLPCLQKPQPCAVETISAILRPLDFTDTISTLSIQHSENNIMNAPQPTIRPPRLPGSCDSCQYCQRCDIKPGTPRNILRFCSHGMGSNFVELHNSAASGHDCPATGPLRRSANPGQRPGVVPFDQYGQTPSSPPRRDRDDAQRGGFEYTDAYAADYSTAHWGQNYGHIPRSEGRTVYAGLTSIGHSDVHAGNNYEIIQSSRVMGPQYGTQQVTGQPATDLSEHGPLEGKPFRSNNPYYRR
jgi:hypothetical protein